MVFSPRVRRTDDAMKYFCLDNKKKDGCIGEGDATMIHIAF